MTPLLLSALVMCGDGGGGGSTETGETVEVALLGGILDASFGTGGTQSTDVAGLSDRGQGVALQSDGKIVVCGLTKTGTYSDLLVLRYDSDGILDPTFGGTGIVITPISSEDDAGFGIQVDGMGRIFVAGFAKVNDVGKIALVRYQADGKLDATFGDQGISILDVGDSDKEAGVYSLELQDGKAVAVGAAYFGGKSRITAIRCTENGSLDTSFGDGSGVASAVFGPASVPWSSGGKTLHVDEQGRIVAGGWVVPSGTDQGADFALVRFDAGGKLDSSFNSNGTAYLDMGNGTDDHVYDIASHEGKLVAVGNTDNGTDRDFAIVRLNEDGTLDWKVTLDYSQSSDELRAAVVGSEGEIYLGGTVITSTPMSYFTLACLNGDGTLRTSFGTSGYLLTTISQLRSSAYSMVRQADGKLIQVGSIGSDATSDVGIARYQ